MDEMKSTGERSAFQDAKEGPAAPCTIAKAYGESYVNWATKVMLGAKLKDFQFKPRLDGYAIKVPVFSFDKFPTVDKSLGPEMKSTGEAIYFIKDLKDPFFRQVYGERSMYLSR
jgi:carbamoyl-phosphate synthase large subunit